MSDIPESMVGHFCDREQYAMFVRCSKKEDFCEWNEWRFANQEVEIRLQGAMLSNTYCQRANLHNAYFQGANFSWADCQGASFEEAHCEGANFGSSQCQGAKFRNVHCEGADFNNMRCQGVEFIGAHCEGTDFRFALCTKANFWDASCERAIFREACCAGAKFMSVPCQGAIFEGADCRGAFFHGTNFENANFRGAVCEGAIFEGARCVGAHFENAQCEEANFNKADCQGANFYAARFSSSTQFLECSFDDSSNFSCTALESTLMEPGKRARMAYNIRRFAWEKWYDEQEDSLRRAFPGTCWQNVSKQLSSLLAGFWLGPIKFFWSVSDYGYSTGRVIKWFVLFILLFTSLYTCFPNMLMLNNTSMNSPLSERFFQMLTFATSTMVTLGFSNINVAIENGKPVFAGMFVVSCNLIVGYFMLAVLVTRLGILFQSQGPGDPRTKKNE